MTQGKNIPTELVSVEYVYEGYLLLTKEDVATLNSILSKNIHMLDRTYSTKDMAYKKNSDHFSLITAKTVASHSNMPEILDIMKYLGISYGEAELAVISQELEKIKTKYPHLVKGEDNELSSD